MCNIIKCSIIKWRELALQMFNLPLNLAQYHWVRLNL